MTLLIGKTIIEARGRLTMAIQHQVHKVMVPLHPVTPHLRPKRPLQVCLVLESQVNFEFIILKAKGQKKSKWSFQVDVSSEKRKNKFYLLLWNLRLTCFRSFFGGNWRHQKDILRFFCFLERYFNAQSYDPKQFLLCRLWKIPQNFGSFRKINLSPMNLNLEFLL